MYHHFTHRGRCDGVGLHQGGEESKSSDGELHSVEYRIGGREEEIEVNLGAAWGNTPQPTEAFIHSQRIGNCGTAKSRPYVRPGQWSLPAVKGDRCARRGLRSSGSSLEREEQINKYLTYHAAYLLPKEQGVHGC